MIEDIAWTDIDMDEISFENGEGGILLVRLVVVAHTDA